MTSTPKDPSAMTTPTLSANPSEANSLASSRAGTPSPATGSALGERSHDQASDSGKLKTFLSILKKCDSHYRGRTAG